MAELIQGTFGALVMVIFGLLAIASFPLSAILCVLPEYRGKKVGWKYYLVCGSIPFLCLGAAIGMFILRAVIALYFDVDAPVSLLLLG